jgi:hypothetical protein
VAVNCGLLPAMLTVLAGVTEMLCTVATATLAVPEIPPEVAVTVVVPAATAVTRPDELTLAAAGTDELQVTVAVISVTEPSEKLPLAVNCSVEPGIRFAEEGITVMAVSVTGCEFEPEHPKRSKVSISEAKRALAIIGLLFFPESPGQTCQY